MATPTQSPFAPGSVSLRLYPHELEAPDLVRVLLEQAALASAVGFDGVMTAEHHGGFRGYLPNPTQVAGWCLDVMDRGWAAPCPILLPLRHWTHVAEELAWLANRFPGRLGAGFGAGGWQGDFDLVEIPFAENLTRFKDALPRVVPALRGGAEPPLSADAAIASLTAAPLPLMLATGSPGGMRLAASLSLGVIFDSLQTLERIRALNDAYTEAGGTGPRVLIRRAWIGDPPDTEIQSQMQFYRSYTSSASQSHWGSGKELVQADDGAVLAERLAATLAQSGCDALNLRVHLHGVPPGPVSEQIERIGTEAIPLLHAR